MGVKMITRCKFCSLNYEYDIDKGDPGRCEQEKCVERYEKEIGKILQAFQPKEPKKRGRRLGSKVKKVAMTSESQK